MGKQTPITVSSTLPDGREITIETGKLAALADGSALIRIGDTMLLATAVSSHNLREGQSFFPLSVDYQEKFAGAGKIPGNFFRREGRLSDYEILTSRLVDRAIRPLFPDGYMFETQVIINMISGEAEEMPDCYAALAASAAMTVSDIPFQGPISEVRVALIDGKYVVNPMRSDLARADLEVIVAATMDNVMMVEGEANECTEEQLIEAIRAGHEVIKTHCKMQEELAKLVGDKAVKRAVAEVPQNEEVATFVKEQTEAKILAVGRGAFDKGARKDGYSEAKDAMMEVAAEKFSEEFMLENGHFFSYYFEKLKKSTIRKMMISDKKRLDGRAYDEVRHIWSEVDYLPSAHGSAVFTRGETQSLTSMTLGTKSDELMVDTALNHSFDNFILHYNFPPYSVGEARMMRGPGRREVGHANLAGRSLRKVLPAEYPYTIRIVSDILESNGSSSMATVCAGTLAMMDAGVPIKAPVSGIAMGMVKEGDDIAVLSDILGDEDALGDMDFKVTGTREGITACQMDIKIDGLPYEQLIKALNQAKEGRIHILDKMAEALAEPREDLKPHAPRIVKVEIDKSFIGAVIGPGGKVIQELQAETETNINIEEKDGKGIVLISSSNKAQIDAAVKRIKMIAFRPEVGDVFDSVVKTVMPYGVFVDFAGQSGLLHVSEFDWKRVDNVEEYFKEGDEVKVKLVGVDERSGKLRLSRKALLPRPEGMPEPDERDNRRGGGGGRGPRGPRGPRRD